MNRVYAPLTVLALLSHVAGAELVEVQASGIFQSSLVVGDATIDLTGQAWQLTFVYEQSEIFTGSAVRSAIFTFGDESTVLDIDAAEAIINGFNHRDDDSTNDDSVSFSFLVDGHSLSMTIRADSDWWYHPNDGSTDWHSGVFAELMPTTYDLNDFHSYDMSMALPDTYNPDNYIFPHNHSLQITSLTARAVPGPAGLTALGVMGLASIRRRR